MKKKLFSQSFLFLRRKSRKRKETKSFLCAIKYTRDNKLKINTLRAELIFLWQVIPFAAQRKNLFALLWESLSSTIIWRQNFFINVVGSSLKDLQSRGSRVRSRRNRRIIERREFLSFSSVYLVNCISRSVKKKKTLSMKPRGKVLANSFHSLFRFESKYATTLEYIYILLPNVRRPNKITKVQQQKKANVRHSNRTHFSSSRERKKIIFTIYGSAEGSVIS